MSSGTTVIVALIAAGYFKSRVLKSIRNIELATNHVEEGEPTLIERVNSLKEDSIITKEKLENYQSWVISALKLIAREIGVGLPVYKEKDE